jgi:outer membrane protein TolC
LREREYDVALPLWLPGQREARRELSSREDADSAAALAAARLELAGELRTAVWNAAAARADVALAEERHAAAVRLEADIARRVTAGDLARTDLLLAREETLAGRAALAEASSRERQTLERYRLLTGLDQLPVRYAENAASAPATTHPRQRLAETAAERARAQMHLARESDRNPPELSVGLQQTRDDFASGERNSVRFGLRIPFATEGRNAPRIGAANTELIRAEADRRQIIAALDADQREARALLDNAQQAQQAAQERATLAAERLDLLQRAFTLGEMSLAEFMRVRNAAAAARLEATRAELAAGSARARLNQALGVLP